MKFSILIANYNNGRFFRQCYDSILAQTYDNWEAVIVDDCSTDNSVEIIKEIIGSDARFKLFLNEKNSGVGVTKARLIELATGEICGFVDPDDAILPKALSAAAKILMYKKNIVLTYSRLAKCDENLKIKEEFKAAMQVPNGDPYFFNCPIQIAPFVAFKKSAYLLCESIDPNLKIAEDQDLYYKLYEVGEVRFINQTDYLYRSHGGGISQNDNKQKSYEYWSEVIFAAMKRRGLKIIHGKPVPEIYPGSEEIFKMLDYQNKMPYRIRKKIKIMLQNFF